MNPKIFLIQSFQGDSEKVHGLVSSAAASVGCTVDRGDSFQTHMSTANVIHEAIKSASLVVADLTDPTQTVMYEIGYAEAQGKPMIFIAGSSRGIPSDLVGVQFLVFDPHAPSELVRRLSDVIAQALNNPGAFAYPISSQPRPERQRVFISYSHLDRDYLDRLLVHLKPLETEGLIDLWVDTYLRPGDRWKKEIEKALTRATVAILIVSADFLASDFITNNELPPILRNAEEKGTRVIPLIVKPCRFTRDKNLRHFQAINDPRKSLILLEPGEQEAYFDSVAAEVEQALEGR